MIYHTIWAHVSWTILHGPKATIKCSICNGSSTLRVVPIPIPIPAAMPVPSWLLVPFPYLFPIPVLFLVLLFMSDGQRNLRWSRRPMPIPCSSHSHSHFHCHCHTNSLSDSHSCSSFYHTNSLHSSCSYLISCYHLVGLFATIYTKK